MIDWPWKKISPSESWCLRWRCESPTGLKIEALPDRNFWCWRRIAKQLAANKTRRRTSSSIENRSCAMCLRRSRQRKTCAQASSFVLEKSPDLVQTPIHHTLATFCPKAFNLAICILLYWIEIFSTYWHNTIAIGQVWMAYVVLQCLMTHMMYTIDICNMTRLILL
jgi:hypothetical protein